MGRLLLAVVVLAIFGGCGRPGQPAVDPFLGPTRVPPPATGTIGGRPPDPGYLQQPQPAYPPPLTPVRPMPPPESGAFTPPTSPLSAAAAATAPGAGGGARPGWGSPGTWTTPAPVAPVGPPVPAGTAPVAPIPAAPPGMAPAGPLPPPGAVQRWAPSPGRPRRACRAAPGGDGRGSQSRRRRTRNRFAGRRHAGFAAKHHTHSDGRRGDELLRSVGPREPSVKVREHRIIK